MSTYTTKEEKTVDEKRAQYEQFEFAVCNDGEHVNVANLSYGADERGDHIYTVSLENGKPVECGCPHHQFRGARCKHIHAVASNEVVLEASQAAQSVALTDGGQAPDACQNGQTGCDGPEDDDLPCFECYLEGA